MTPPEVTGLPSVSGKAVTTRLRVGAHAGGVLSPLGRRIEVNAGIYLPTCREPFFTRTFRACEMRRVDAALAAIAADPGAVARCCPGHAVWAVVDVPYSAAAGGGPDRGFPSLQQLDIQSFP